MRETKFRGKAIGKYEGLEAMGAIDENGWATGNLIQNGKHTMIVGDLVEFDDEDMICEWWVPIIPETVEQIKVELNENQQIVLNYLKNSSGEEGSLMLAVRSLCNLSIIKIDCKHLEEIREVKSAFRKLTRKDEEELLQAFAEWGLSDKNDTDY